MIFSYSKILIDLEDLPDDIVIIGSITMHIFLYTNSKLIF